MTRLAVILGPYRNLTTLSAAILSLHPDCQVLNHAAERLLAEPPLDFFTHPDSETFDRFIAAALEASGGGRRGDFGGSILHSHAYDNPRFKQLYAERYGDQVIKPDASCLVWKDSMRIQRRFMADDGLFERVCAAFPDLRFFLPIRDPLDCATSNLSTGHITHLGDTRDVTRQRAIELVVDAFAWVLDHRDRYPDRIFVFTQGEAQPSVFIALAEFLRLRPSETWVQDATAMFTMRRDYRHDAEAIAEVRAAIRARLGRWPDLVRKIGY